MLIPCMTEIPPRSDKQLTIELSIGFLFLFSVGERKANRIAKISRVGLLVGIEMGRMSKGQMTNSTVFKSFYPSNGMTCGQIQISTRLPLKVQLWILRVTAASSSIHTQIHNWTFTKATKMIQVGVKEILLFFVECLGSVRDDVNLTRDALIISTSFHISVSPHLYSLSLADIDSHSTNNIQTFRISLERSLRVLLTSFFLVCATTTRVCVEEDLRRKLNFKMGNCVIGT